MSFDFQKIISQLLYNANDPLLFNSGFFFFYFLFVILVYQLLYKHKLARIFFFTLCSFYFFYKACGFYFLLIVLSAVVDFNLSNWIYKTLNPTKRKLLLVISVVINLGSLAYFKYTNFFIDIINDLQIGQIKPLYILLPIGISFYTFENLSYTIDVYRKQFKPVKSFLEYCFFLSFFPKLVMGPIVRASDFIPQIKKDIFVSEHDVSKGLFLIMAGLFKKVVVSDYIYINYVQYIFDTPEKYSGIECLFGVYGYALVIYCDFSGYSDMAIGMAQWMGFSIPANFNTPYQSTSITEFWRRWHISLSSWLRDYLYIPLGGNKKGKVRQYFNLFTTMLLGGLWHGASWNFVIWGALHGTALAIDKLRLTFFPNQKFMKFPFNFLGWLITFNLVCFCWIFFKAETLADSVVIIKQIFTNLHIDALGDLVNAYGKVFMVMGLAFGLHLLPNRLDEYVIGGFQKITIVGRALVLIFIIWLAIQSKTAEQVLPIYLQF